MFIKRLIFLILGFTFAASACGSLQQTPTAVPINAAISTPTTATIEYQADEALFPNPERGWVQSVMPANQQSMPLSFNQLLALRNSPDQVTLIRKYYYIGEYRKGPLPPDFLLQVEQDLRTARAAGVKLIPRFVYIWVLSWNQLDAPV